jgi:hypothetical protein
MYVYNELLFYFIYKKQIGFDLVEIELKVNSLCLIHLYKNELKINLNIKSYNHTFNFENKINFNCIFKHVEINSTVLKLILARNPNI